MGGIAGYVRRRSRPSLVAGIAFGTGIAVAANSQPERPIIAALLSLVLAVNMGSRFLKTRKMIPSGVIGVASTGMVLKFAMQIDHFYRV